MNSRRTGTRMSKLLSEREFTLVLGGGGLKGLAHVGVLAALERLGARPRAVIGTSIGALIGAAWCSGISTDDIRAIAVQVSRKDIFRVAHTDMAFKRMRSPALFQRTPLVELIEGILGSITFDDLQFPIVVNTVDLNSGQQILWGAPGLTHIPVADAVYASCALPGYLPPIEIEGRYYGDGGAAENLPVRYARAEECDLIVAVDVGSTAVLRPRVHTKGFAAVYARSIEIALQNMRDESLGNWQRPPMVLIQPRVDHIDMFSFRHNRELVNEGQRAALAALSNGTRLPDVEESGVFPRRRIKIRVEPERCIGCRACIANAPPGTFTMDRRGKAVVVQPDQVWSPVDGGFVYQCPTAAIVAKAMD